MRKKKSREPRAQEGHHQPLFLLILSTCSLLARTSRNNRRQKSNNSECKRDRWETSKAGNTIRA